MSGRDPGRFPVGLYALLLVLILIFSALPLILALGAGVVAEANGCLLNEGSANTCLILGVDWAEALYVMFVLGWAMYFTAPLGFLALVVLALVFIIHLIIHLNARRKSGKTPA